MTHRPSTRAGRDEGPEALGGSFGDGELASLVRRWMDVGRADDADRPHVLRLASDAVDPAEEPEAGPGAVTDGVVTAPTPQPPEPADGGDVALPGDGSHRDGESHASTAPLLPRRPIEVPGERIARIGVLIDARRVTADAATGLLAHVSERGAMNVCRAYADWSRSELGDYAARMRREGLHSFHQYADDDDQALVAMAIDAVDIARDAAIDELVIAGDLSSALPLVHRLHIAGVRVVGVGVGHTPHEVRAACDDFLDAASVAGHVTTPAVGRHRA